MPEDVVYKMLSAFYKNRDKLAKTDPGFTPMAKDFVGMQVNGINANPDIPVHAGPRQVPEGTQGLERQVEDRRQRQLIVLTAHDCGARHRGAADAHRSRPPLATHRRAGERDGGRSADREHHARRGQEHVNLRNLIFVFSLILFAWLIWYFYTGSGGPQELVARLLPIALILQILFMYQNGLSLQMAAARSRTTSSSSLYIGICCLRLLSISAWSTRRSRSTGRAPTPREDFIVGLLMFLLVMELSRLAHPALFWINVVLVVYTLWGYLSPLDFFWHPGTSFYRVVTSSTVEISTGIYGIYGQIALTTDRGLPAARRRRRAASTRRAR